MEVPGRKQRKFSTLLFGGTFARTHNKKIEDEAEKAKQLAMQAIGSQSMHSKLSNHWQKEDMRKICSDLPRLVSRVVVRRGGDNKTLWSPEEVSAGDGSNTEGENVKSSSFAGASLLVVELMKFLVNNMEEEEVAGNICEQLDNASAEQDKEGGASVHVDYFENLLQIVGADSRCYRVLKCIHQDYVLIATTDLKMSLTRETITKDVRGEEGWKIFITLAEFVQIVHRRKEQSMDMPGSENNHFEFTYTISMTFDKNMEEMTAALLKIQDLDLGAEMDPEFKNEIQELFANGSLIVS